MKTGTWYVCGFVVAFVYFYVYAVNYVRGVRGASVHESPESLYVRENWLNNHHETGRQFRQQHSKTSRANFTKTKFSIS